MPYSPPAGNAVLLNFTGTYSPPYFNAVLLNFGGGAPPPPVTTPQLPTGLRLARFAEDDSWFPSRRQAFAQVIGPSYFPVNRNPTQWVMFEEDPYIPGRRKVFYVQVVIRRRAAQIIG